MKAVGLYKYLPIDHPESLLDLDMDTPVAAGHDRVGARQRPQHHDPDHDQHSRHRDRDERSARLAGEGQRESVQRQVEQRTAGGRLHAADAERR